MKTIFLSAGVPVLGPNRDKTLYETADLTAIRDAVLALVFVCLRLEIKIVWGGHPAITPIVYEAIRNYQGKNQEAIETLSDEEITPTIQKYVHLFQSAFFKDRFPKDNNRFNNVTIVERGKDISESLRYLRDKMLDYDNFIASIYIGGMEGVVDEHRLFSEKFPEKPFFPIASTGGAALQIYNTCCNQTERSAELLANYAYTSLFYSLLQSI